MIYDVLMEREVSEPPVDTWAMVNTYMLLQHDVEFEVGKKNNS